MNKHWQTVALGEVLKRYKEEIKIDELQEYKRLTIRMYGNGILVRDSLLGTNIQTKNQFLVKKGQLLLSKIDARNGAFGLIPNSCDNAIITGNFWAFDIDEKRLYPKYFEYVTKTLSFLEFCIESSEGTTNRKYLREPLFLNQEILLPPLTEQRRIVARIEVLAAKNEEAKRLRQETITGIETLVASKEMQIWNTVNFKKVMSLNDVTTYLSRGRQSKQGKSDHFLIKTQHVQMGKYVTSDMTLSAEVADKVKPEAMLKSEDILIACSAAGCLGRVAFYEFTDNKDISTDTHIAIARANPDMVLPKYLYAYLKGAQGQNQLRSREKGNWQREKIGFRFTELNVSDMRKVPVPVPSFEEQKRIVAYLHNLQTKVDAVKQHQAETQQQLNALTPAILDKAFKGEL